MRFSRIHIATFIALLFHVSGWIGIAFTPYREWFIHNTPLNLCLMAGLLIWCQPWKNTGFFLFLLACFVTGMGVEMIGVNTGQLFGNYQYGNVLGEKLNGVPWLIGLNWFLIIYCSGSCMFQFQEWFMNRFKGEQVISQRLQTLSFIADSALLATFFDWVMEPVAMHIGFWQWNNGTIPFYNYICWFLISALLLGLFRRLSFEKVNHFAVHLFIIQVLFFLALRTQLNI